MLLLLAAASLAFGVFLAAQAATLPARERREALRRALAVDVRREGPGAEVDGFRERVLRPLAARFARVALRLSPQTTTDSVRLRLAAAGMRTSPSGFLAAKGGLAGAGLVFAMLAGAALGPAAGIGLAAMLGAIGFILPDRVLAGRARTRRERIQNALPDALDLLAVSMEAGLGFDAAVAELTARMDGPLVDELALVLNEMRIGRSRHEALRALAERIDAPELSAFVRAIVQAEHLGGSFAHILAVQAADVRIRRQSAAEEQAMKAPVKMLFPTVLFIFPAMFIVILGPALLNFGTLFG